MHLGNCYCYNRQDSRSDRFTLADCLPSQLRMLIIPLARLDRVNGVIGGDLLDRLAATDRLHGEPGLELGTVGKALAHEWEPPFGGDAPHQKLTMGPVQNIQTTSAPPESVFIRNPLTSTNPLLVR